ncbi:HAMP domain-containing protein [Sphingomonas sp. SRS2]|uniref:HAMP domain-containing protein n=1 Tax=Sphingomonas sp. SRS2 TaxID=133190 RepID=UPI000695B29D|nr:HAMP domain-containing protein [Sphingomonas sp. SRS2]
MRRSVPIQTLLLRVFLPAIAIVAIGLGVLTYNRLYATILEGFDRKLITTSALTGAMIDGRDHDRLIAAARAAPEADKAAEVEHSREYLSHIRPMRRIREELGLTYLYTQILGGDQDIIYVLDSSEGDEHSLIGSEDDLPDETLAGVRRSIARGTIHLSPIEYQEQWGLLKTAAAPLRAGNGRITATAGADVNVSLIQVATQNALFTSVVIGMASLLACVLAVLLVVRSIARPLDRLRQEALRIAGGDHAPLAPFPAPRDIARLRTALADSAAAMTGRLADARDAFLAERQRGALTAIGAGLRQAGDAPALQFAGPTAQDSDALLRRAAAARLAARVAADPDLAARIEAFGPVMRLADGETAAARLPDGRTVTIGSGS